MMKVLIAGGGTGGHINPGIAIAKYISNKNPEAEILFVGTEKGMETNLVPREGFKLELITVRGFKRKLSWETLTAVKEMFQGVIEAFGIVKKFTPDIVIGTGGYVCGPVLFAASLMRIPTMIHEQNALPGVTNKILSRFVDAVAISFKESQEYFKTAKKIIYTGNPVRSEVIQAERTAARQKLGIDKDTQMVVVFGGSLGAEKINRATVEMMLDPGMNSKFRVVLATGNKQYESTMLLLEGKKPQGLEIVPYIYNAADMYAAADIIVCRGGAITMSELPVLGVPCIIIPSPYVAENHQEYNARALEKQGAAVVILEKDLNANLLYSQIMSLLNDREQLNRMARCAKRISIPNATEKIYSILREIIKA